MRLIATVAGACVIATAVSGCSGSGKKAPNSGGAQAASSGSTSSGGNSGGGANVGNGGNVVEGGTFTLGQSADPGNLDPQASAGSTVFQLTQFAYDNVLSQNAKGEIQSGLASKWRVAGNKVVLTIRKGVTCADGAAFTAADVAANITYMADPKNKSAFLGAYLPAGAKAAADAATGTVTMTLAGPSPFVLNGLANLPMVCAKGMKNRKLLARGADGTGPYQLSEAVSGDHYTYTKRTGYTWGPNGATTATPGLPAKIVAKIVSNETTAVNLLLAGGLSAVTVRGADIQRLEAAHLFSADVNVISGQMWYNHTKSRPGAEVAVRQAMTSAVDLAQLAKVLTSGRGGPGTEFAAFAPTACPGNSVTPGLPEHNLDKGKQLLDAAGWKAGPDGMRSKGGKPLAVTFAYNTAQGSAGAAAAQLAAAAWKQLGIAVTLKPQDETGITNTLFTTGNWDVVFEALNVSSPDQIVSFMAGPTPPNGTNFAHITNPAYSALVKKATAENGSTGCADWLKAETELVKAADVIPFANQIVKTFAKKAQFQITNDLSPTSIRMLAK